MESKLRFNRCCNPLKLLNHSASKGLGLASAKLRESWNLSHFDYLCSNCRKTLGSLKSVASGSNHGVNECDENDNGCDTGDENSDIDGIIVDDNVSVDNSNTENCLITDPITDPITPSDSFSLELKSLSGGEVTRTLSVLSLNTQLPVINDALPLLNIPPIDKYAINNPTYLSGKYNEICSTFATLLGLDNVSNHYENSINYQNILINLKSKYDSEETTRAQKLQILTILPTDWSIQKICDTMGVTKHMAITSKSLKENKGVLSAPEQKKGRPLSDNIKSKVIEFYKNDDVSVNLPGMKDFVSVRNDNGQREHIQKKLILCNLKELYVTFKEQYPDDNIGFPSFASLRPVNCVLAGSSGTHTVCVCAIHQNIKLMMLGSNLSTLTHETTVPLVHYSHCFKLIPCSDPTPDCYFSKCEKCPGIGILRQLLESLFDEKAINQINYKYWISSPRCSLETLTKSSSEFVEVFCEHINNLLPHDFIAKSQSAFLKQAKESLQDGEFLAVCDFAKNYAFIIQDAVPGFHWNNNQATIFPVVIYFKQNGELKHQSLIIISDSMNHDAIAVHVYLKIVTDFIKELNPQATKVIYFSDGAPQQFKNFKHFVNIYYHDEDFGLKAGWHSLATAHGKGPCDGAGGTFKRKAAKVSLQRPVDKQITTTMELYKWASEPNSLPNMTVKFSPESDYAEAKIKLDMRYNNAKSITGTQKLHSILPKDNGTMQVKDYSSAIHDRTCKIFKKSLK